MIRKSLKKMECSLGFVQIPSSARSELIDTPLPCSTTVNGAEAKLDKFGRLWSPALKARFSVGTMVELKKNDTGYDVFPVATGTAIMLPIAMPAPFPQKVIEKTVTDPFVSEAVALE